MRNILILLLPILFSCSSTPNPSAEKNEPGLLEKIRVTQRDPAPEFPFEKFYQTSGIGDFQFSSDGKSVYFLKSDGKVKNVFQYDFSSQKTNQVTFYKEPVSAYKVGKKNNYLYVQKDIGGSEVYDLYRFDLKSKKSLPLTKGKNVERSYLCDLNRSGTKLYYSQSRETRSVYDIKELDLISLKSRTLKKAKEEMLYCGTLNESETLLSFQRFIHNNEQHFGVIEVATGSASYILEEKDVSNRSYVFHKNDLYFLSTRNSDHFRLWKYSIPARKLTSVDIGIKNSIQAIGIYHKGKVSAVSYRGELKPELSVFEGVFEKPKTFPSPLNQDLGFAKFSDEVEDLGVFSVENSYTPSKYYLIRGEKVFEIYDSNQSGIKNRHFAKSHSQFVESFDGLKVPVHYFIPNGTSSKRKRPALFWIHGGPEEHVDPVYSPAIQFLVNRGYVVVTPNVRGSTGFGKAYQFKDNADWGGGHIKDIVAVAEHTKKLDFIDENNVFIVGGSFGGFSVMSTITQYPDVFKAAVNVFGLVEMASFMDSWPPIHQKYWISEMGKDPRKDAEFNRKLSPIYHVQNIKIPTQVHQGANDIRVPQDQSDRLVKQMKKYGLKVDYQVYPDEGHGFLKFANSKRCFEKIAGFLSAQLN